MGPIHLVGVPLLSFSFPVACPVKEQPCYGQLLVRCPWGNQFFIELAPPNFVAVGAHVPSSTALVALAKVEFIRVLNVPGRNGLK